MWLAHTRTVVARQGGRYPVRAYYPEEKHPVISVFLCLCGALLLADAEGDLIAVSPSVGALPNGTPLFLCYRLGDADLESYGLPASKYCLWSAAGAWLVGSVSTGL